MKNKPADFFLVGLGFRIKGGSNKAQVELSIKSDSNNMFRFSLFSILSAHVK